MIKKCIAVFLIFFLGTSALITVDHICGEQTGIGGKAGLSVTRTEEDGIAFCFFGLEGRANP